ncbi:MAG: DUF6163 family protein [Pseudomonadota bacterium]
MSIVLDTVQPITKAGRAERIYLVFVRCASFLCLIGTIGCWAGLSGISSFYGVAALGTQVAAISGLDVSLAALFPVAMLGLWLRARWGVAIWIAVLLLQIVAYGALPGIFGDNMPLVMMNAALLAALAIVGGYLIYSRYVAAEAMSR